MDQDHLYDVDRHTKIFGITPDINSKENLQRALDKMQLKSVKFRRSLTNREIERLQNAINHGQESEKHKEQETLIRYKLMKTASWDLARDFESKIGKISNNYNNDDERRRLLFKGLSEAEYHKYFDNLFHKLN